MLELSACRMCLAVDARMFTIGNTPLQDIYERITSIPLQNEDKRLEKVCYLCHHLLRKTQAFKEKAVTADKRLRQALERGMELTEASMRLLDTSDVRSLLCVSRLPSIDFVQEQPPVVETQGNVPLEKYIKVEPIDVKQEIEVEEHSAIAQQYEDENILGFNNEMKTMVQNVGGGIQDERLTMGASMGTTPGEDEANYLQSSARISKKSNLVEDQKQSQNTGPKRDMIEIELTNPNEEMKETTIEQGTKNNPFNEDSTIGISHVNLEVQSRTDMHLDKVPKNPHLCSYCNKSFTTKQILKRHIFTHTGEKPYPCNQCGMAFIKGEQLKRHILTHTGEKPHRCSHCNKEFTQKSNLNTHMAIHTGEKPHRCEVCDKVFSFKGDLKRHSLTHTGEKPHQCFYCNKVFSLKSTLNTHILLHTGEKPYRCSYCNKDFTQKSNLNTHMVIHTREKPH